MSLTTKFKKKSAKNTKLVNLVKNLVFFVVKKNNGFNHKVHEEKHKEHKACEPLEKPCVLRG
ncbi:hypothetical protein [Flavobacterium psychrophilum]|uniref:hypothetical protein n=1 Tax=Flavobacterium psychrophilum TaxID=96345 RepID=UPI0015DFC4A6|nr:hypothetical protein [Flavobacterium psychrophilum]